MVKQTFQELDENMDGVLSFEEFKRGVENNKILVSCFANFS